MALKGEDRRQIKGRKKHEAEQLDLIDHRMLAELDRNPGISYRELGELVGMSEAGVRKRYGKPRFRLALEELKRSTWDLIQRAKQVSARRLMSLANDKDPNIALRAAQLLFGPTLQDTNVNVKTISEIIYQTKFGDDGQIINEVKEVSEAPKNTLELIGTFDVEAKTHE